MSDLSELLNTLTNRFDKDAAGGLEATYAFEIKGENKHYLKISEEQLQILQGKDSLNGEADVTLSADKETWQGIIDGSVTPQFAFMLGKLSIKGQMPLALKLPALFNLG